MRAATACDLFALKKTALKHILEDYPDMRVIMEQIAVERLAKLRQESEMGGPPNDGDAQNSTDDTASPPAAAHSFA